MPCFRTPRPSGLRADSVKPRETFLVRAGTQAWQLFAKGRTPDVRERKRPCELGCPWCSNSESPVLLLRFERGSIWIWSDCWVNAKTSLRSWVTNSGRTNTSTAHRGGSKAEVNLLDLPRALS